jgi:hypothetical protein
MVETGEYNVDNYVDNYPLPVWGHPPHNEEGVVQAEEPSTSIHIPTTTASP